MFAHRALTTLDLSLMSASDGCVATASLWSAWWAESVSSWTYFFRAKSSNAWPSVACESLRPNTVSGCPQCLLKIRNEYYGAKDPRWYFCFYKNFRLRSHCELPVSFGLWNSEHFECTRLLSGPSSSDPELCAERWPFLWMLSAGLFSFDRTFLSLLTVNFKMIVRLRG